MRLLKSFFFSVVLVVAGCADHEVGISEGSVMSKAHRIVDNHSLMPKFQMGEGDACSQYEANKAYSDILKGMGGRNDNDFFGGAYVDKEGRLVVYIKGDLQKGIEMIRNYTHYGSIIDFKPCRFSYKELNDVVGQISEKVLKYSKELKNNISVWYVDDSNNRVVVGLNCVDLYEIMLFKKYISESDAVVFEVKKSSDSNELLLPKTPPTFPKQKVLQPGGFLHAYNNSLLPNNGSWAFRAQDYYADFGCMVTAAHVLPHDSAYLSNLFLGVAPIKYITQEVDATYIIPRTDMLHYRISLSNTLATEYKDGLYPIAYRDTVELDTALYSPVVGTIVNKRGWTTGPTTGTIISTNFCITYLDNNELPIIVTNKTYASFLSDAGDSGGIVYTYFSNVQKRYTTGILQAQVMNQDDVIIGSFYTKADVALTTMELERY